MRICRGLAFHILDVASVAAAVEDGVGVAGIVLDEPIDFGAVLQVRGEVDARSAYGDIGRRYEPEVAGPHSPPHVVLLDPLWGIEANYLVGFHLAGVREVLADDVARRAFRCVQGFVVQAWCLLAGFGVDKGSLAKCEVDDAADLQASVP